MCLGLKARTMLGAGLMVSTLRRNRFLIILLPFGNRVPPVPGTFHREGWDYEFVIVKFNLRCGAVNLSHPKNNCFQTSDLQTK